MKIGLDVMGGDYAPQHIVVGAIEEYSRLQPDNVLYLFGDQSEITGICRENDFDSGNFVIVHCFNAFYELRL